MMGKIYFFISFFLFVSFGLFAQSSWLAPQPGFESRDIIPGKYFSCHDIQGGIYGKIIFDNLKIPVTPFAAPVTVSGIANVSAFENAANRSIDLSGLFTDPDDDFPFTYHVSVNSEPAVASATIDSSMLTISFLSAGQTNVTVQATSGGKTADLSFVVGVYPEITGDYEVSDFENLNLTEESYWNGVDNSGGFTSGTVEFDNTYNANWAYWSGWAYSNMSDTETAGYMNQYSAFTGVAFDAPATENDIYAVATNAAPLTFTGGSAHEVKGFYITNTTYTALSMKQGDAFTKKFGGEEGTDPDFFKLNIWGMKDGVETDTVEFYLADFRFEDHTKDYIIETWQWVELSPLGKVDSLLFGMESSDVGDWGINTPLYFAADNFYLVPDAAPEVVNPLANVEVIKNSADTLISLMAIFTDADDNDAEIVLSVAGNSNSDIVSASITGDELTLSFATDAVGEAEIVIEAISNGKTVTHSFVVTISPATGIEDLSVTSLVVYPNPSDGRFRIKTNTGDIFSVHVFDVTGKMVYMNEYYSNNGQVDISDRPAGQYLIHLKNGDRVQTRSIIKQ